MYKRIVRVPATNPRRMRPVCSEGNLNLRPSASQGSLNMMDSGRTGNRQPTEHPNDRPHNHIMGNGVYNGSPNYPNYNMAKEMENLSMRTPSEHQTGIAASGNPVHNHQMTAMQQSQEKVQEWRNNSIAIQDDLTDQESFVIDQYTDTMRSDISMPESEYGNRYRTSSSIPDDSISRRSGFTDDGPSSDDDTGLQRSMVGIQSPPEIDSSACSRQNSNGSQSSLDSSLSFHTVYPSDAAYQHRAQQQRQADDRHRRSEQQTAARPPREPQQSTSTRPPATASTEPYFVRSQSQPGGAYGFNRPSSGQSGQSGAAVRHINQRADEASRQDLEQKSTSVFITYAEERHDKNFRKLVLQLTRTLLNNGIQVRLDMLESTLMSMSVSSWLDDNIKKCDFIVICVSPSYKSEVEPGLPETPDPHSLHTRYIYSRLLTEYIGNGSRNFRFIPVLIGGATRRDLPSLCHDTHVYEWPSEFEEIIYRLFKKEKYVQPRVGPTPRCTVETYESQDERLSNHH
ncbi:uncharacterized protein LOC120334462 isoform X2 [Styela clava]